MKKNILLIMLLSVYAVGNAQTHGDLSLEVGIPQNEFREKRSDAAFGAKFSIYFPVQKKMPLFVGFGLGYMGFGSKTQMIHEDLKVYAGSTLIDVIPIDMRATTNNNLFHGYLALRYKFPGKVFQPYIEGQFGFNNFYTRTTIYDVTPNRMFTYGESNNVISSSTSINSTTYNYGPEAGFIIPFGKGCSGINFGIAYLWGGEAKYYNRDQIQYWTVSFDGPQGSWDPNNIDPENINLVSDYASTPNTSETDMLVIRVGVTFGLCQKVKTTKATTTKKTTTTKQKTTTTKSQTKSAPPKKVKTFPPPPPPMPPPPPPPPPPPHNPNNGNNR